MAARVWQMMAHVWTFQQKLEAGTARSGTWRPYLPSDHFANFSKFSYSNSGHNHHSNTIRSRVVNIFALAPKLRLNIVDSRLVATSRPSTPNGGPQTRIATEDLVDKHVGTVDAA